MTDGLKPKHRAALIGTLSDNPKVERIVLFGSRAMETFTPASDVDIALFGSGLTLGDQAALSEAVAELSIPQRADILIYHRIGNQALREHIRKHGVEWFARRKSGARTSAGEDEWVTRKIGDIAEVVGGSTPSTKDPQNFDGDIPWITPRDLSGEHERRVFRGARNLTERGLNSCSAKLVPPGSVLLTTRAPIGYVAIAGAAICANQGFRCLLPKECADSGFLYYWLRANTEKLEQYSNGSTFKELSGSALKGISVYMPSSLPEQRAIAHILGTLDDKIELNRRMNETLEGMARALFQSWFVDFDPVRAKAEGRDPGLPKNIAELFPDGFEESELGEIPRGWGVGRVDEEFDLTMGQSPPGDTYNETGEGLPFYQGRADFTFRFPMRRVYCTAPTRFAKQGDTLVSVRAPVGDINMAGEECAIGRGVAAVRHKSGSRSFTYYSMRSFEAAFTQFEAEGTVFGSISKRDFHNLPFIAPHEGLVAAFERLCGPLDAAIARNAHESRTLASLRDALLPKLLSGELRVGDAARFVGAGG